MEETPDRGVLVLELVPVVGWNKGERGSVVVGAIPVIRLYLTARE